MYSTGNSKSSFDSRSLVCLRMKSYWADPSCGKPIMVSITGSPTGPGMKSSDRTHVARATSPPLHTETLFYLCQGLAGLLAGITSCDRGGCRSIEPEIKKAVLF